MKITAADISQKQFMTMPHGLDAEEVYAFLEVIKEDFYELEKENAVLKEKVVCKAKGMLSRTAKPPKAKC